MHQESFIKNIKPFLRLPFAKQKYHITEGYYYSDQEKAIHGFENHGGIDFALKRGTPVFAAADGMAIFSYFSYPLNRDNKPILYKNKQVWYGLGYFVQIYHPKQKLYSSYGHLESIAQEIKFHNPRKLGENY